MECWCDLHDSLSLLIWSTHSYNETLNESLTVPAIGCQQAYSVIHNIMVNTGTWSANEGEHINQMEPLFIKQSNSIQCVGLFINEKAGTSLVKTNHVSCCPVYLRPPCNTLIVLLYLSYIFFTSHLKLIQGYKDFRSI